MRTIIAYALWALSLIFVVSGCDSGGGGGSKEPAGVAGEWNGTGNYVHNNVPITKFNLSLTQNSNAVKGTYSILRNARPEMNGSVNGQVDGDKISLTMNPHGFADGTVSGDSMNLDWTESGFGGAAWTNARNASVRLSR
jgi:hypothetical protein